MNKKTLIILVAVVVVVLGVVLFLVLRSLPSTQTPGTIGTGGTLPPVATGTIGTQSNSTSSFPSGSTFSIGTPQGSVTVKNFYNTDAYVTQDNSTVVLVENDNYTIVYNRDDSGFIIALLVVPGDLQSARNVAEADFLNQLGISQSDACKLTVDERVLDKTSQYDGDLMSLSFCNGGTAQ